MIGDYQPGTVRVSSGSSGNRVGSSTGGAARIGSGSGAKAGTSLRTSSYKRRGQRRRGDVVRGMDEHGRRAALREPPGEYRQPGLPAGAGLIGIIGTDETDDRVVGQGPESAWQVRLLAAGASLGGARRDMAVQGGGVEADPFHVVLTEQLLDVCFELWVVVEGMVAQLGGVAVRRRQRLHEGRQRIHVVGSERRRQLDRQLLGTVTERGDAFQELAMISGDVAQMVFVGDGAWQLEHEPKTLGSLGGPRSNGPRCR